MTDNEFVVTRRYHDDGSGPTTTLVPRSTYVSALPRVDSGAIQRVADTTLAPVTPAEIDGSALAGMRTVSEVSTPTERAWAVVIQGLFICLITGIATYALTLAGASGTQVVTFFIVLLLGGVAMLVRLNYSHSPIGNERHKASLYADVQKERIAADKEVQLAKVDAFREYVGVVYGRKDLDG